MRTCVAEWNLRGTAAQCGRRRDRTTCATDASGSTDGANSSHMEVPHGHVATLGPAFRANVAAPGRFGLRRPTFLASSV